MSWPNFLIIQNKKLQDYIHDCVTSQHHTEQEHEDMKVFLF